VAELPAGVLIASRSPAYAAGLAVFLADLPVRVRIAHTVDAALAVAEEDPPALAVVDWLLADAPGSELARALLARSPSTRILASVPDADGRTQLDALAYGACGIVLPTWTREAVVEATADAMRGVARLDLEVVRSLADLARRTQPREVVLTDQERVVLRLMRQQLTYKEIALRLEVSWHTVRSHAQSILRKLGVHSRRDLDAWDARMGAAGEPAANGAAR